MQDSLRGGRQMLSYFGSHQFLQTHACKVHDKTVTYGTTILKTASVTFYTGKKYK